MDRTKAIEAIETLIETAREAVADGRPADARNAWAKASALARESSEPALQAQALRHLSDLDRVAGRAEMALASAEQAIALYRVQTAASPLDLANGYRLAALALEDLRRYRPAVDRWGQARALYAEVGVQAGVDECDGRLAASA